MLIGPRTPRVAASAIILGGKPALSAGGYVQADEGGLTSAASFAGISLLVSVRCVTARSHNRVIPPATPPEYLSPRTRHASNRNENVCIVR